MKVFVKDKIKHLITQMITKENDEYAKLLFDINNRVNPKYNAELLDNLNIVHDTKIKLLEEIFEKLKEIK